MNEIPVLDKPERLRPIVQEFYTRGKKKGKPVIYSGINGNQTRWYIQDEDDDCVGVLDGDLPDNAHLATATGKHPHVYITGKVGENSEVDSREREILSARSIGRNGRMSAGRILILGDEALSRASLNFTAKWEQPLILVVPEESRALVFGSIIKDIHSTHKYLGNWTDDIDTETKNLRSLLAECGVQQYRFFADGREQGMSSPNSFVGP